MYITSEIVESLFRVYIDIVTLANSQLLLLLYAYNLADLKSQISVIVIVSY